MMVGVIAILALTAAPSYIEKIIRDQIVEAMPLADAPIVPVAWVCGNAPPPDKMTVKGQNKTDVPALYLPFKCRP